MGRWMDDKINRGSIEGLIHVDGRWINERINGRSKYKGIDGWIDIVDE